jgi:hypothetical protein
VKPTESQSTTARPQTTGVGVRDITFVVRASGERTADAAVHVLRRQIACAGGNPDSQVLIARERPFVEAVRRTISVGLDAGRPWTVGMDADVLLVRDGVEKLRRMCETAKPDSFTVTGLMLCKFYGGLVFRGVHCYRGTLLESALPLVGSRSVPGMTPADAALKPESAVVHAMAAKGHGFEGHPTVLAAHDFEQSFKHVYLKNRLRARREAEKGDLVSLTAFVRARSESDRDFLVALWGIEDGAADAKAGRGAEREGYDWLAEYPEFDSRMARAGLNEKTAFGPATGVGYADRILAAHEFESDVRTPEWVRSKLGFADGWSGVQGRVYVDSAREAA